MTELLVRLVYGGCTLYMLMILFRWLAPWLEVDVATERLRWLPRLTDPLVNRIRQVLPPMGPVDFGPLAALVIVWFARSILTGALVASSMRGPF